MELYGIFFQNTNEGLNLPAGDEARSFQPLTSDGGLEGSHGQLSRPRSHKRSRSNTPTREGARRAESSRSSHYASDVDPDELESGVSRYIKISLHRKNSYPRLFLDVFPQTRPQLECWRITLSFIYKKLFIRN